MESTAIDFPGVDCYQLFCSEAMTQDSSIPQIYKIQHIFEAMTIDDFTELAEKIFATNDYDLTSQFLYFLLLFRDMPHLQNYINSNRFSLDYFERFVIFVVGFCSMHELSTEWIIDRVLYFISGDRLLDLVLKSKYIARDKLLLFLILTRLDAKGINKYFASIKDIADFKKYFLHLPDKILRMIISRNYQLFQYVMMMMLDGEAVGSEYTEFFNKNKYDIEQFSKLNDVIRQYKNDAHFNQDKNVPFDKRDTGRISFLVKMIKDMPDPEKAINYFNSESLFIDEYEKKLILAIVTNPLLKDVCRNYCK
jgi:hypothetical protein